MWRRSPRPSGPPVAPPGRRAWPSAGRVPPSADQALLSEPPLAGREPFSGLPLVQCACLLVGGVELRVVALTGGDADSKQDEGDDDDRGDLRPARQRPLPRLGCGLCPTNRRIPISVRRPPVPGTFGLLTRRRGQDLGHWEPPGSVAGDWHPERRPPSQGTDLAVQAPGCNGTYPRNELPGVLQPRRAADLPVVWLATDPRRPVP